MNTEQNMFQASIRAGSPTCPQPARLSNNPSLVRAAPSPASKSLQVRDPFGVPRWVPCCWLLPGTRDGFASEEVEEDACGISGPCAGSAMYL
jgi:hypothetical protein